MAGLVLGPQLRFADETSVTVWVETEAPGTVTVRCPATPAVSRPTFTVHGHHYAIVPLVGLPTGGSWPYTVELDGEQVWPVDEEFPASELRTIDPAQPLRVVFGSCRTTRAARSQPHPDARRGRAPFVRLSAGHRRRGGAAVAAADARRPGVRG
ncbi:MAG TPA: hypothetical protein VIL37_07945 [Natronosporangium sp.]